MFFRAFYAIPQTMRGPDGKLNNAVRGTLDTLARYVTDRKPRHVAFTTDEDWRPDWRVELVPSYKEHRTGEPIPPALIPQVPVILDSLEAVGVDVVGLEGYEAEDIIASLAAQGGLRAAHPEPAVWAACTWPRSPTRRTWPRLPSLASSLRRRGGG